MASTGLTKAFGAGNRRTWTLSLWVKRSGLASVQSVQCIMAQEDGWNGNGDAGIYFDNDRISSYNLGDTLNSGNSSKVGTNRLFRDTNAWYHLVFRFDSTQSTASDRFRIYVNGVQETSMLYSNYPSQNYEPNFNRSTRNHGIGKQESGTAFAFDGSMSHIHFCDGYSYDATAFGEYDANGVWTIKTDVSVTYGTNGFFILKDGNSVTDQSGNSNNFTVGGGTLTKTEDCPDNVFATFNPLSGANTMAVNTTFSNGNTTVVNSGTVYNPYGTTLGVNKGKWYAEFKTNNNPDDGMIGIFAKYGASGNYLGSQAYQYSWYKAGSGNIKNNSSNLVANVGTYTTNDIIGIALDCDNNKLYFHKNGTYISNGSGTGDPTNGNYGISITDPDDTDLGFYFMSAMDWGGNIRGNWSANFGNGYFGTTAVASAGTNASGIGIFEFDVPTGYTALSTKGLNL